MFLLHVPIGIGTKHNELPKLAPATLKNVSICSVNGGPNTSRVSTQIPPKMALRANGEPIE